MSAIYVPLQKDIPEAIEYMSELLRGGSKYRRKDRAVLLVILNRCSDAHLSCVACQYQKQCQNLYDWLA